MRHILFLLCCSTVFLFASCERAFMESNTPFDPETTFEYLWSKVDQQYAFFDIKGVNWDSVHNVYRPLVYEGMDEESLFNVCAAMLNTLRDGHTNLVSSFDKSRNA